MCVVDHEEPCGPSLRSFCLNGGICYVIPTIPSPFCRWVKGTGGEGDCSSHCLRPWEGLLKVKRARWRGVGMLCSLYVGQFDTGRKTKSQCGVIFKMGSVVISLTDYKEHTAENLLNCSSFGKVVCATLLANHHKKSLVWKAQTMHFALM